MRGRAEVLAAQLAWTGIDLAAWSAGALASLFAAAWLQSRRDRYGSARTALVAALTLSGGWTLTGAILGIESNATAIAESLRNLGWIFAIYRLFEIDGRHASMKPVRPMLAALAFVELLQVASVALLAQRNAAVLQLHAFSSLHLLAAIGGLVLTHNLFGGASQQARLVLRWPAASLALVWMVDLNHSAIAFLSDDIPQVTGALRGLLGIPVAGLLVLGAGERSEELRFRPSRAVAFQSVSLALIGAYLIAMVAAAQWLAYAGSDYSVLLQVAFVATASLAALALATSQKLRGWLRVTVIKHLFQLRYDYRAEWLRLNRTIGQAGPEGAPLGERVIRSLADIAECPAGLLLTCGDGGELALASRWQWPTADVPMVAIDAAGARAFERDGFIADLDQLRRAADPLHPVAEWLMADPKAWALVPLLHFDRIVGMVVLARPAHARELDWEDFDLLRVVGRQLASYLAENAGQSALAEAARFDDFHRRIAFVMHDIKNLASQMGLLARNAEQHADNPEFRADMLVTLRNSTDKLNALIARLSRYGAAAIETLAPVRADLVAQQVVKRLSAHHPVTLVEDQVCEVMAAHESLEQVLLHLVQNAIDASPAGSAVFVSVSADSLNGTIEVVDSGTGMSAEFVRKPFESTKPGGFGIGAYEAAELVKAMRGQLDVESREGLGTRFIVRLPLAEAAVLFQSISGAGNPGQKVA
jgi:putative PEP-CTERM system histidine kinase